MSSTDLDALIEKLVNASSREEKLEAYKAWATRYDKDLDSKGYIAPELSISCLLPHVPDKHSLIYDAGCGTGRVGVLLSKEGYSNLIGADFSAEMLEVAEAANCYRELQSADYTQAIELDDNSVDAAISVGVYSQEFKELFIKELTRIVKPRGVIVLSCRPVHFAGFAENDIQALIASESVRMISSKLDKYMIRDNSEAYYIALEVRN